MGGFKCTEEEEELNMDTTDSGQGPMDSFEISGVKSAGWEFRISSFKCASVSAYIKRTTVDKVRPEDIHVQLVT
jgi:hypothetical protein